MNFSNLFAALLIASACAYPITQSSNSAAAYNAPVALAPPHTTVFPKIDVKSIYDYKNKIRKPNQFFPPVVVGKREMK
jgi:hypothetical protein